MQKSPILPAFTWDMGWSHCPHAALLFWILLPAPASSAPAGLTLVTAMTYWELPTVQALCWARTRQPSAHLLWPVGCVCIYTYFRLERKTNTEAQSGKVALPDVIYVVWGQNCNPGLYDPDTWARLSAPVARGLTLLSVCRVPAEAQPGLCLRLSPRRTRVLLSLI